jgi:hypothetical protein
LTALREEVGWDTLEKFYGPLKDFLEAFPQQFTFANGLVRLTVSTDRNVLIKGERASKTKLKPAYQDVMTDTQDGVLEECGKDPFDDVINVHASPRQ